MIRSLALLPFALALAFPAAAQDADRAAGDARALAKLQSLQQARAPGKQIFMSRQLDLSSEEATAFWPVYDSVQAGLADLDARRTELLQDRDARVAANDFDDGDRSDLVEDLLRLDRDAIDLLEGAFTRLRRDSGFPVDKAQRYLALELDLRALRHFERSETGAYALQ